jgi:hypothetical protein
VICCLEIRRDERLRRVAAIDSLNETTTDAERVEPIQVGLGVHPDRRHRQWFAAEQLEVVGDVARATAELAAHLRNEEGNIQDVDLVRQDMVGKPAIEHHDRVVRDGTADESAHCLEGRDRSAETGAD